MQSPALSDHDNTKDSLWMYNCEIDRAIAKSPFGLFSRLLWLGIPHRLYKACTEPGAELCPSANELRKRVVPHRIRTTTFGVLLVGSMMLGLVTTRMRCSGDRVKKERIMTDCPIQSIAPTQCEFEKSSRFYSGAG